MIVSLRRQSAPDNNRFIDACERLSAWAAINYDPVLGRTRQDGPSTPGDRRQRDCFHVVSTRDRLAIGYARLHLDDDGSVSDPPAGLEIAEMYVFDDHLPDGLRDVLGGDFICNELLGRIFTIAGNVGCGGVWARADRQAVEELSAAGYELEARREPGGQRVEIALSDANLATARNLKLA